MGHPRCREASKNQKPILKSKPGPPAKWRAVRRTHWRIRRVRLCVAQSREPEHWHQAHRWSGHRVFRAMARSGNCHQPHLRAGVGSLEHDVMRARGAVAMTRQLHL